MEIIENFNTVWIPLTYDCNNLCKWCYAGSNIIQEKREAISLEKALGVVDFLSDLNIKKIIYIGGEPTKYDHLEEVLERTRDRKIKAGIISNGRKFKDEEYTKKIKNVGVDYVSISLTHSDSEKHDEITQVKGSFHETMRGIDVSCKEGIRVATNTVISNENYNCLERIVDLFADKPIQEMTFNICGVCISEESNNSYLLNPKEAVKSFEKAYSYAKSKGIRARLVTPMPLCFFDSDLLSELKSKKLVSGGPCQLVYGRNFVIEPDGGIVPCTHLAHYPLLNIFEDNQIISADRFKEQYNSSEGLPYLFRKKVKRYPSSKCEEPNCNEPCSGGCPLFWLKFDPEKEIKGMKDTLK